MYQVKVTTHRGVKVVAESNDKALAIAAMGDLGSMAVVVNSTGRIVATNVRRTF